MRLVTIIQFFQTPSLYLPNTSPLPSLSDLINRFEIANQSRSHPQNLCNIPCPSFQPEICNSTSRKASLLIPAVLGPPFLQILGLLDVWLSILYYVSHLILYTLSCPTPECLLPSLALNLGERKVGLETLGLEITLRILWVKKQDVRSKTHSCPGFLSISFSYRERQLSKPKVWEAKAFIPNLQSAVQESA